MSYLTLQIKQADEWTTAVIPSSSSITVEQISTIFDLDAGGGFSYPFTLPVEANQHLFPTMTNNHGAHIYDLIYHKPFRLFVGGVPLLHGVIDMDDEVDIETQDDGTHTVAINLASDNQELSALLDGVNCQDVPVKDRIPVGTEYKSLNLAVRYKNASIDNIMGERAVSIPLPSNVFSSNLYKMGIDGLGAWQESINVSEPYPTKAYCNARVAIQKREKQKDGTYKTLREYEIFEADRPNSGICFYVQYFLDCVFHHVNIKYDNSAIKAFEDMNRLAFFNTKCECDSRATAAEHIQKPDSNTCYVFQDLFGRMAVKLTVPNDYTFTMSTQGWTKYANSKNFPDMNVMDIIRDLQNAFGIRFVFSSFEQSCKAVFVKDIFNNREVVKSSAIIHQEQQTDYNIQGVKMTFGVDDEENTDYNYSPKNDNSHVVVRTGYAKIKGEQSAYDKSTYYDTVTGNMYRIKVDEDAANEKELYPSLFEVGMFNDACLGDTSEEEKTKEINVSFTPVVCNITEYTSTEGTTSTTTSDNQGEATDGKYAVFLDVEISDEELVKFETAIRPETEKNDIWKGVAVLEYKARYGYTSKYVEVRNKSEELLGGNLWKYVVRGNGNPIPQYDEDPIATYDAGYTLGIMRGPGNQAGIEIVQQDYDGNGNARWAYVPKSYAFTADSIDHFGNIFDYNGSLEGGATLEGRTSLKLQGEKVSVQLNQKIQGNSVVISTAEDAAYWLGVLFPNSAVNLLAMPIKDKKSLSDKGWSVEGLDEYSAVYPYLQTNMMVDNKRRLLNVVRADGIVQSAAEMRGYGLRLNSDGSALPEYYDSLMLVIKEDATQKDVDILNALVKIYYFPETAAPYTLTDIPEYAKTAYYPIDSSFAHRGLFHKFNYEYAWFLIHSRLVELIVTMSLAELSSIDLSKWYTFGQYTGLIKQLSYSIDNEKGLSEVTVQLYYI